MNDDLGVLRLENPVLVVTVEDAGSEDALVEGRDFFEVLGVDEHASESRTWHWILQTRRVQERRYALIGRQGRLAGALTDSATQLSVSNLCRW